MPAPLFRRVLLIGDPVAMMIPPGATAADVVRLHHAYGLDQPILTQFGQWCGAMLRGDFGRSISYRQGVAGLIAARLPATLELALLATLLALPVGAALAIVGVRLRRGLGEWLVDGLVAVGLAVPDFLWGLLLVLLLAVVLPILPVSGRIDPRLDIPFATHFLLLESLVTLRLGVAGDILAHMIMPATALALPLAAGVARVLKTSLADAEQQDYARLARARGFGRMRVLLAEALPNAAVPTVALTGVQITFLLGGTVLIERLFAYDGIGNMAIEAVINRDLPLIQGLVLVFALLFIAVNLVADLLAAALDPRSTHG
jgi:peptide/nickel transport system permease protein